MSRRNQNVIKTYWELKAILKHTPLTVNTIINYIYNWYRSASLEKLQKHSTPIQTEALERKYYTTLAAIKLITSKFNEILEKRLKQLVFDLIKTINTEFGMYKKKAKFVGLDEVRFIVHKLWTFVPNGRGFSEHSATLRKQAAVHYLLAMLSGGRWKDVSEIHWSDVKITKMDNDTFVQIFMRRSKNNEKNETPQCMTFRAQPHLPLTSCPLQLLQALHQLQCNPTKGKIFNQVSGRSTLRAVQKMCLLHNTTRPTGHSARVSTAVTLFDMGMPFKDIRLFMNWKTDKMIDYYTNIRSQLSSTAPAARLADVEAVRKIQKRLR